MKRITKILILLFLLPLLLPACHAEPKHSIISQPKVVFYETLEDLESASDLILRCTRLENAEPQLTRNGKAVTAVQTLSQVEIIEIIKDNYGTLSLPAIPSPSWNMPPGKKTPTPCTMSATIF